MGSPSSPARKRARLDDLSGIGGSSGGSRPDPYRSTDQAPESVRKRGAQSLLDECLESESDPKLETEPEHMNSSMPTQVDWRKVLCKFLGSPSSTNDEVIIEALQSYTRRLQAAEKSARAVIVEEEPEYETIYRVRCVNEKHTELFLDPPWTVNSGPFGAHLRGSNAIENLELHLERHKQLSFIVYKDYCCCEKEPSLERNWITSSEGNLATNLLVGESVCIISEAFSCALEEIKEMTTDQIPYPIFDVNSELKSPYLWWYHQRKPIIKAASDLDPELLMHLGLFQKYINSGIGKRYEEIDQLLSRGQIQPEYMEYLYVPGQIVLSTLDGDKIEYRKGYIVETWLHDGVLPTKYWGFDGLFQQNTKSLPVRCPFPPGQPFDIQELKVYPIQFAASQTVSSLRARGTIFWQCRRRKYVCYKKNADTPQSLSDARYMIDYETYKEMHPPPQGTVSNVDDLGYDKMDCEEPPLDDGFVLCLPVTIPGYNMQKKVWEPLHVSRISSVEWDKKAFQKLVIEDKAKELVEALVTNQIDVEEGTDIVSGKGNGLFILLHGGPGTGKTLTAESVAEVAQRPLYRVTCGDVGTNAEDVEQYLKTVLLLGKTWGCVVLLDEADVFLEQRSLADFQRNALVSVFLRVLEYYDGILILTSNRVGTFDAAFKSRIQLSLRYPKLQAPERQKIWENFLQHLENLEQVARSRPQVKNNSYGIESDKIRMHIPDLAVEDLNGREIRNAVSTARQLARFQCKAMGYEHLQSAIEEMKKFDKYSKELNRDFTDDEIARDKGEY